MDVLMMSLGTRGYVWKMTSQGEDNTLLLIRWRVFAGINYDGLPGLVFSVDASCESKSTWENDKLTIRTTLLIPGVMA